MTGDVFYELLDRLTAEQTRAILTCLWVHDDATFARAAKAAGAVTS
jgi:hypothetical protein